MEKKAYEILTNKRELAFQNEELLEFMTQKFFKPLITPFPIVEILKNIQMHEWSAQQVICSEGEKIDAYYFLLEGCINVYKKNIVNEKQTRLEIVKNISVPSLISDSLFTRHPNRSFTVIISDNASHSHGFSIKRQIIEGFCGDLIKQHKFLKTYFCNFLNVSSERFYKIDLYENVLFKTFNYGQKIKIKNEVLIIYSGECLMSYEEVCENRKQNDSPFKNNNKKYQKYRPLIKLCENECFGTEQIYPPKDQNNYKFKYVVSNQKMVAISITIDQLANFPKEMSQKIKQVHDYHIKKLEETISYQNLNKLSDDSNVRDSRTLSRSPKRNSVKQNIGQERNQTYFRQKTQQSNDKPLQNLVFSKVSHSKSQFMLPNAKSVNHLPKIDEESKLNQTQTKTHETSKPYPKDLVDLKKKYIVGFDLKNKCQRQSLKSPFVSPSKETIKQPKGYFSFGRIKRQQNQHDSNNSTSHEFSPLSKNKDWSRYIRLPKIY